MSLWYNWSTVECKRVQYDKKYKLKRYRTQVISKLFDKHPYKLSVGRVEWKDTQHKVINF